MLRGSGVNVAEGEIKKRQCPPLTSQPYWHSNTLKKRKKIRFYWNYVKMYFWAFDDLPQNWSYMRGSFKMNLLFVIFSPCPTTNPTAGLWCNTFCNPYSLFWVRFLWPVACNICIVWREIFFASEHRGGGRCWLGRFLYRFCVLCFSLSDFLLLFFCFLKSFLHQSIVAAVAADWEEVRD